MVTNRVHIAPVNSDTEPERVIELATDKESDKTYLLTDGDTANRPAEITDKLEDNWIEVETVACNQQDIYAVFGLVTTLADRHTGDEITVNVSTAGKRAAIGATLACMDDSTDAAAHFVDEDSTTATGTGANYEPSPVPSYTLDSPTREQVAGLAMTFIVNTTTKQMKKWMLIDEGLKVHSESDQSLMYAEKIIQSEIDSDNSDKHSPDEVSEFDDLNGDTKKGAYRRVDNRVLDELRARDYVTVEKVGTAKRIELTDGGENALRAFRHKVTDVIEILDEERQTPDWLSKGLQSE